MVYSRIVVEKYVHVGYIKCHILIRITQSSGEPSPVGAGDSFTAAFVSGMLGGLDLVEAHRLAVDTSAFVCTMDGAMPVLPAALKSRVGNDRA